MKKTFLMFLYIGLLLAAVSGAVQAGAAGPQLGGSEAYCIIDAENGMVLAQQNMDLPLNPASITKVMTLGLACEKAGRQWDQLLTVSHEAVYSLAGTGSTHIGLREGEQLSLHDLLLGTMMESANDGANVLAEFVGGSIAGGVAAMNARVQALGLENTHFANPHGLTHSDHYTSCYDMAQILRWALGQPGFAEVFERTEGYKTGPTNLREEPRYFNQQDSMKQKSSRYYIPSILGSKLGYTDAARYTYVCLAEKNGVRLICTVMHSQNKTDKYSDVAALLDYAFAQWTGYTAIPAPELEEKLPVWGGGSLMGNGYVKGVGTRLLLAEGLSAEDVTTALEVPEAYYLGQESAAVTVFTVHGRGLQEDATVRVRAPVQGLQELYAENIGIELEAAADVAPPRRVPLAAKVASGVAVLLLMILLGQNFAARRRSIRRRRARESAQQREREQYTHKMVRNKERRNG